MKFSDCPPERIAEWNADEVTQAFIAWLISEANVARDGAISAVRDGQIQRAAMMTGAADAFTKAALSAGKVK